MQASSPQNNMELPYPYQWKEESLEELLLEGLLRDLTTQQSDMEKKLREQQIATRRNSISMNIEQNETLLNQHEKELDSTESTDSWRTPISDPSHILL
jgi:hypothetical protein